MMPPRDAIRLVWNTELEFHEEKWTVFDDALTDDSSLHISVINTNTGATFAIMVDGVHQPDRYECYAVFLGVKGNDPPLSRDEIALLGQKALSVYYDHWHEKHPDDYSDLPKAEQAKRKAAAK